MVLPFVAHYRRHKAEYTAAVTELLAKASLKFSTAHQLRRASCKQIPVSASNSNIPGVRSAESLKRTAIASNSPSDHFLSPNSMEFGETRDVGSLIDEHRRQLFNISTIKPHGILSQILFDVCVPMKIEGWDIKPISFLNKSGVFSPAAHGTVNPVKCIKRSRL